MPPITVIHRGKGIDRERVLIRKLQKEWKRLTEEEKEQYRQRYRIEKKNEVSQETEKDSITE